MITEHTVPYLMDIQTARTAAKYAEVHNIDKTEALRQFIKTRTYDLLLDPEGYLYFESMESRNAAVIGNTGWKYEKGDKNAARPSIVYAGTNRSPLFTSGEC